MASQGSAPAPVRRSLVLLRDWDQGIANLVSLIGEPPRTRGGEELPWLRAVMVRLNREEQEKAAARGGFEGICELLPRQAPEILPSPAEHLPLRAQGLITVDAATGAHIVKAAELAALRNWEPGITWCLGQICVAQGTQCSAAVRIAMIDTGVEDSHPDLAGRIVAMRGLGGGGDCSDYNGHGTHCAGIAAGAPKPLGGSRYGTAAGTAAGAALLAAKVFNDKGDGSDEEVLAAIHWAVEKQARVINLSLGSARLPQEAPSVVYDRVASRLLERNVLLVAAAGNASSRPRIVAPVMNPAACGWVTAVAATDENRKVAKFSCGDVDGKGKVDLSAPGVHVWSAFKGWTYTCLSGTSMAAPHVAGVAALLMAQYPEETAIQIRERLTGGAQGLGEPSDYGAGLVQYRRAEV